MTQTFIPQVLLTLSPQGHLQAELPGALNGQRRVVPLKERDHLASAQNAALQAISALDLDSETQLELVEIIDKLVEKARYSSITATLERMLEGQLADRGTEIGQDGAPTAAQVRHWEDHSDFAKSGCRFCIAEGRIGKERGARPVIMKRDGVVVRHVKAKTSGLAKGPQVARATAEEMGL